MDELFKELERFRDLTGTFTPVDIAMVMFLGFTLSMVVAWVYRNTHKGMGYSQSYVHTLIIMGTVVSLIMLIIGSNIARAFALVGALSIIRFRNAMKETRDVGFIFMVMAIGMAVGTRFYMLAVFSTAALSAMLILLSKLDLFAPLTRARILRIQLPVETNPEQILATVLDKHLKNWTLLSLETVRAGILQQAIYSVDLKSDTNPGALMDDLRKLNDNNKVSLVLGERQVDI